MNEFLAVNLFDLVNRYGAKPFKQLVVENSYYCN